MNVETLNGLISKYLNKLQTPNNNINEYKLTKLNEIKKSSQLNHLISICKLFETNEQRNRTRREKEKNGTLEHADVNKLTENDIYDFLASKWFNKLKGITKNQHILKIRQYLIYSNRQDLADLLPKKIKGKARKISKNDLIERDDLDVILKHCNLKMRTLLMILYEGALRINEALSIKRRDIKFVDNKINLKVAVSKTGERDLPLYESIPYVKEYLTKYDFKPEDKIFYYKRNTNLNVYLYTLGKRLANKYPEQWEGRRLYPHIFRHSRLTELASNGKMNEPLLRKFAGWTADSNMPKIYFHLDDSDLEKVLEPDGKYEPKKTETFKPKECKICNAQNNIQNLFCWKCGNVFKEEDKKEIIPEIFTQPYQIEELKTGMNKLKHIYRILYNMIEKEDTGIELAEDYKSFMEFIEEEIS